MNKESVSTIPWILASMNSWFTPTVLFVLLNVMICTIAVTSGLGSRKHPNHKKQQLQNQHQQLQNQHQQHESNEDSSNQQQKQNHQQNNEEMLKRSPSVLERLKSINIYASSYRSQEPISIHTSENNTQKLDFQSNEPEEFIEGLKKQHAHEENEKQEKTMEEVYGQLQGSHNRTKSDTKPYSGELPVKLPKKMRKSASVKSAFSHFEDDNFVETRRPASVKDGKSKLTDDDDDEEVDAKADDFINKFKQQLKLQRLDSIVRYKKMLNRG